MSSVIYAVWRERRSARRSLTGTALRQPLRARLVSPCRSDQVRVALVGCGRWGGHILRDLLAIGCDVPVVARSDESRERARGHGATEIVAHLGELPPVDAAVVATPTTTTRPSSTSCCRSACRSTSRSR
jgi:D-arabinose 1-dehydrogenase-like Zn-dependent alcohol dehydrogenase